MTAPIELDLSQYYALHFAQIKVAPYFKCKMMSPFLLLFLLEWHHVTKTLMYVAFNAGLSVNGDTIQMLFVRGGCVQNQIYRVFTFFNKERSSSPSISCSLAHLLTLGGGGAGATYVKGKKGGGEDN
jgi:hypothetical protein